MKIRTGYVSNSSSSSFILKDVGFFKHFGITKQDILDAIIDLYGGQEHLDKLLKIAVDSHKQALEAAKSAEKKDEWSIKYHTECLEDLKTKGLELFCVYDMTDSKDKEACYKEWDEHFSGWWAPAEGECSKWEELMGILRWKCSFDNAEEVASGEDDVLKTHVYDASKGKACTTAEFKDGVKLIRHIKEKLDVKTMKEVLHDKDCTLMIHFADNEVYGIKGMEERGKADKPYAYDAKDQAEAVASQWDSKSCSAKRFFEILIKHFIAKGKISLSDPRLLEFWNVANDDAWHKTKYPGKKTYLANDSSATWQEVFNDMLNCNAIMHEG